MLALAEVLDRLPPVVVDKRTMKVVDGVHRVEASRRVGRTEIRAVLFSGSETEALVVAVQANIRHGKPLSRSERQAAAGKILRGCPDRSDRWVADVCGLSHSTVARIRQAATALGQGVGPVGTDGAGRWTPQQAGRPSPRRWQRSLRAASARRPKLPAWPRPPCTARLRPFAG